VTDTPRDGNDPTLGGDRASGIHANQPVLQHGPSPRDARCAVILLHGRGDSAGGILTLAGEFDAPDVAWLAPQAAGRSWYPRSFLAPLEDNEPALTSALSVIAQLLTQLDQQGVPAHRVVLSGFSQGACLVSEFAATHPRRYGAVVALSGGLIGPPGMTRSHAGSFDGMPAMFGCSDIDPHIPLERVVESIDVYRRMGAEVDDRIYPGLGHTVIADEISAMDALLRRVGA
jgi:predicted esterase